MQRIYPTTLFTAPHFIRNYDEDGTEEKIKIRIDETGEYYELPKQCHFAINIIGIHRNAKFWVKPNEYYEHIDMMKPHLRFWIDDNMRFKPHKSLFVFSFGKRECVGKAVAIKNLFVILSALMMRYKFSVPDPSNFVIPTIDSNLLTPAPCKIRIEKRVNSM